MKKQEFLQLLEDTLDHLKELTATKGEEYSRDADQLANFHRAAAEAGVTAEQAWLVFFNKHIDSVKTFIKGGTITEGIESRIDDAILYLCLFKALVNDRQRAGAATPESLVGCAGEPYDRR